jgi:hypothetical protein
VWGLVRRLEARGSHPDGRYPVRSGPPESLAAAPAASGTRWGEGSGTANVGMPRRCGALLWLCAAVETLARRGCGDRPHSGKHSGNRVWEGRAVHSAPATTCSWNRGTGTCTVRHARRTPWLYG